MFSLSRIEICVWICVCFFRFLRLFPMRWMSSLSLTLSLSLSLPLALSLSAAASFDFSTRPGSFYSRCEV